MSMNLNFRKVIDTVYFLSSGLKNKIEYITNTYTVTIFFLNKASLLPSYQSTG